MKNLILFIVATLVLFSCNPNTSIENETNDSSLVEAAEKSLQGKHCFLEIKINEPYITDNGDTIQFIDSTILNIEIVGDKITGRFDWMPAERDGAYGSIEGTIKDDIIKAMYSYTIEGYEEEEERTFKIMDDKIAMLLNGLDSAEFKQYLPRVDCK